MHRTNIYLEERQTAVLDRLAHEAGVSRAQVVRELIDRGLGAVDADLADDLAAIDQSFGVLADSDIDVPPRGRGARAEHLERIWSLTP